MNPESMVALVGIVVSGIISGMSIYLAYKDRASTYHQLVYSKQIEASIDLVNKCAIFVDELIELLRNQENILTQEAKDTIVEQSELSHKKFVQAMYQQLMLIPLDLYNKVDELNDFYYDIFMDADNTSDNDTSSNYCC